MFQFRRFPAYTYFIQCTLLKYCFSGFPHSEIHGSMDICSSPWLIAACHVLRRLLMPRHSPCALSSLTLRTIFFQIWFSVELCRQSQRVLTKLYCIPFTFRCCSTIKLCFLPNFHLKDLSVALLITLISLFSFQGAIASPQASYRSLQPRGQSSLTPLRLLFKSQTLRWFAI